MAPGRYCEQIKSLFIHMLVIRTSISTQLRQRALIKGSLLAVIAVLLWWTKYFVLAQDHVHFLGFLVLFAGAFIIAYGLIPYRYLSRLEIKPNMLEIDSEGIRFFKYNTLLFHIPWSNLHSFSYMEKGSKYGLQITLKEPDKTIKPESGNPFAFSNYEIDKTRLFLSFFNKRACLLLDEWYQAHF